MGLLAHKAHQERPNSYAVHVGHRPETTLIYQIVQEYWPEFQAGLVSHGRHLPAYVTKEIESYLKCGRLENNFLRVSCESCIAVWYLWNTGNIAIVSPILNAAGLWAWTAMHRRAAEVFSLKVFSNSPQKTVKDVSGIDQKKW